MPPNTFRLIAISFLLLWALRTLAQSPSTTASATQRSPEEQELIGVVERFLELAGKRDHEAMRTMLAPAANVGRATMSDGKWTASALSLEQYFTDTRNSPTVLQPYKETVQEYTIHVQDGQMAFVKADATFTPEGKSPRNNIDFFTLIKINDEWKFLTIAWVGKPLPGK
jgi:hypothetical protein